MNRKLAASLKQCLQDISLELQNFTSKEDFKFGYFEEGITKDQVIYFNKENLNAGVKQIQKSLPLYKAADRLLSISEKSFNRFIPKRLNEGIKYASNYKLKRFTKDDFGIDDRREELKLLCDHLDQIRNFIRKISPYFKFFFRKHLIPLKNIPEYDLTIPLIVLCQNIKSNLEGNTLGSEFESLECVFEKMKTSEGKDARNYSIGFENQLFKTTKRIHQLQGFLTKRSIKNLFIYYIFNDVLNIPKSLDSGSLDVIREKYQKELMMLPLIQVKLNSRGETDYTNYFDAINYKSRVDYQNNEIIIHKRKWKEFFDCLYPVEYVDTLSRLPLEGKYYAELSHPYFPLTDSNLYSIFKHLHVKLHFLADFPDMIFSNFSYSKKTDYVGLSDLEILKSLVVEYEKILSLKNLKLSLSSTFKLPKRIADIFLKGVITILKDHITTYTLLKSNSISSEKIDFLCYPFKLYWNMRIMKISPKEVLQELATKSIVNRVFMTDTDLNLFIDSFISFEGEKKLIELKYLNLASSDAISMTVVKRLFYDLRKFYNDRNGTKEHRERFMQPIIQSFPSRFANHSLDIENLERQASNMHRLHHHKINLITDKK